MLKKFRETLAEIQNVVQFVVDANYKHLHEYMLC